MMSQEENRILSAKTVRTLLRDGIISIQPPHTGLIMHSEMFSLRLGDKCLRMKHSIPNESRRQLSAICRTDSIGISFLSQTTSVLEKNGIYLIELIERLKPSKGFDFVVAPRFFSWLLNVRTRLVWILEGAGRVAWLELVPLNYPLTIRYGDVLANARVCAGKYEEVEYVLQNEHTAIVTADIAVGEKRSDGVLMAGPLKQIVSPAVGAGIFEQIDWRGAVEHTSDGVILEPSHLYLVPVSKHQLHDGNVCAELIPYDPRTGKLQIWRKLFLSGPGGPFLTQQFDSYWSGSVLQIRYH
jgi:hypothetical protein